MPLPSLSSVVFSAAAWQFSIDRHLNPWVPPSLIPRLPYPLAHFLGHRKGLMRPVGNLIIVAWAFLGVFAGVSVVNVVIAHIAPFRTAGDTAIVIGSFGAAAVLEFYAIESPLAQPRNAVLGQLLSCTLGVAVGKLFALAGPQKAADLRWMAGSLACSAATAVMALTGTVHPPAGATALIATMDDNALYIGWYMVPAVLLGSLLMQCVALLINNVQRRYPIYWWTPEEVGQAWKQRFGVVEHQPSHSGAELEKNVSNDVQHGGNASSASSGRTAQSNTDVEDEAGASAPELGHVTFTRTHTHTRSDTLHSLEAGQHEHPKVVITRNAVIVPDDMYLRPEERLILETLSERL